ncbi:MAG: sulfur transferase domain-containing protein, partial [Planctomycetota bacterium]|nr:sulfur transferase domain-containing protein [Planctomycetota bacterium]
GIRTVIDLRDSRGELTDACAATATAAGLNHLHLPTRSWPFSEEVEAFLAALDRAERPVLVHCQHGEGRSVLMCALHRVANEGWSNRRAFEGTCRLPDGIKFLNDWFPSLRRFHPAHPKGKFVLSYRPKHTNRSGAAAGGNRPAPPDAAPR